MIIAPFPLDTEIAAPCLATGVFAMGDARYYARQKFPVQIQRGPAGTFLPTRIQDLRDYFLALSTVTESILQAITVSLYYETDKSLIPPSDPGAEKSVHLLLNTKQDAGGESDSFQITVPNVGTAWSAEAFVAANGGVIFHPRTGYGVETLIVGNEKPDKRARG